MSSIIDVKMIMTIHVKSLELQKEFFQDGLGLKTNDTVFIPLIVTLKNNTIYSSKKICVSLTEMVLF